MSNSIGVPFSPSSNWNSLGVNFQIPGLSTPIYVKGNPALGQYLGGGLKGYMPQPVVDHDNSDEFAQTRFTLRNAWNTTSESGSSNKTRIVTPFRAVNNAGDILCRDAYSCGGPCQTFQSRPNVKGLKSHFGSVSKTCVPGVWYSNLQLNPTVPASACNGKYVYDSSDYVRFLKNQAVNRNYNDRSFGGNDYKAAQSPARHIRRY